jgi:hypothetical protein
MRLISSDTYSFGEIPFAWSGLIDPKLFQRYTWLLPASLFTPVIIPLVNVSTGKIGVSIASIDYDVTASVRRKNMEVGEPTFGVCIKRSSTNVSI